jgi:hypothetical protein
MSESKDFRGRLDVKSKMRALTIGFVFVGAIVVGGMAVGQEKKGDAKPEAPQKAAPPGGEKKPGTEPAKDPKGGGPPGMTPEQMKEMEAWMKAMTPGPDHERLKPLVGSWTYALKMRHGGPEASWENTAGAIERKWIMGGRVLQEDVKGPSIMPGHPPFEGLGYTGFDNVQKKYWVTWMDNANTCVMNMEGTAEASGKVFTFHGEFADPVSGKAIKTRHVLTIKDDKTHLIQAYQPGPDGKEYMMFDMTCTKK